MNTFLFVMNKLNLMNLNNVDLILGKYLQTFHFLMSKFKLLEKHKLSLKCYKITQLVHVSKFFNREITEYRISWDFGHPLLIHYFAIPPSSSHKDYHQMFKKEGLFFTFFFLRLEGRKWGRFSLCHVMWQGSPGRGKMETSAEEKGNTCPANWTLVTLDFSPPLFTFTWKQLLSD